MKHILKHEKDIHTIQNQVKFREDNEEEGEDENREKICSQEFDSRPISKIEDCDNR
ncbi:MAG: hypothetical protein ICV56_01945 [Nitrososphaeraceae archaeon]|nr:hypothetical protein [Nitrososphaeraceae archaeon]